MNVRMCILELPSSHGCVCELSRATNPTAGWAVSCVLQHLIENSLEKFPAYISIVFSVDVADVVVVKFVHAKTIF